MSGSLSESEELSEDDSELDSPASRGAWYIQHTGHGLVSFQSLPVHVLVGLAIGQRFHVQCEVVFTPSAEGAPTFAALLPHALVVYDILGPLDMSSLLRLGT